MVDRKSPQNELPSVNVNGVPIVRQRRDASYIGALACRSFLLCLFPLSITLFYLISKSRNESRLTATVVSGHTIVLLFVISLVGVVVERLWSQRTYLIRGVTVRRPFFLILVTVCMCQTLALVLIEAHKFRGVSPLNNDQFKLRGIGRSQMQKQKEQQKLAASVSTGEPTQSDTVSLDSATNVVVASWPESEAGKSYFELKDSALSGLPLDQLVHMHEERCSLGLLSVVMVSYNEHAYMQRTLESLVNSTAPGLLKEIIVIDDASSPPIETSFNTTLFKGPLVKVVTAKERRVLEGTVDMPRIVVDEVIEWLIQHTSGPFSFRSTGVFKLKDGEGLIVGKISGGELATGNIIMFLDAHVKPSPGWALPIIRHINANYKTVVVPRIPVLNGTTWDVNELAVGHKMMFEWDFAFNWVYESNDVVPCMSGGVLAISKQWWHESGELDPGMSQWGAENIEQSVRIWLCGGEIVVARDSSIAHVFRKTSPHQISSTKILHNKVRAVEVWFDEYKEYFYNAVVSARSLRPKVPLPFSGKGAHVDPSVEVIEPYQNISGRLALRERLKCKPFSWYVNRFAENFRSFKMLPQDVFMIRNPSTHLCWSAGAPSPSTIQLVKCDDADTKQLWTKRFNGTLLGTAVNSKCTDAALGNLPRSWATNMMEGKEKLKHNFTLYSCDSDNINQILVVHMWRVLLPYQSGWKLENHRVAFVSFCVEMEEPHEQPTDHAQMFLTRCLDNTEERADEPPSSQRFEIYGQRRLNP